MEHIEPEDLSAYLDEELDQGEVSRIDQHLAACEGCSAELDAMRIAAAEVSALGAEVAIPADDLAVLRQAIPPAKARWWASRTGLAALGAAGLAVVALIAVTSLPGPRETGDLAVKEQSAAMKFASDEQVRSALEDDPEIRDAVGRWTVSDVGAGAGAELSARSEGASDAREAGAESAGRCAQAVITSQPYPMKPVTVRSAVFKGLDAWLLVYAFTPERDPDAPLDRFQIWIVRQSNCSTLHYSFFRPKDE